MVVTAVLGFTLFPFARTADGQFTASRAEVSNSLLPGTKRSETEETRDVTEVSDSRDAFADAGVEFKL